MAFTTNTQKNADGVLKRAQGLVVSDGGAAAALTINVGFEPKHVAFHNVTDRISDEWFEGMAAASSIHTIAAGTRTLETTNGVAVSGNTFTLTAVTMAASKTFVWLAEG